MHFRLCFLIVFRFWSQDEWGGGVLFFCTNIFLCSREQKTTDINMKNLKENKKTLRSSLKINGREAQQLPLLTKKCNRLSVGTEIVTLTRPWFIIKFLKNVSPDITLTDLQFKRLNLIKQIIKLFFSFIYLLDWAVTVLITCDLTTASHVVYICYILFPILFTFFALPSLSFPSTSAGSYHYHLTDAAQLWLLNHQPFGSDVTDIIVIITTSYTH